LYQSLSIFQTAGAMAKNAGARQAIIARNVANADTPGYRARTIPDFASSYNAAPASQLKMTRAGHLSQGANNSAPTETYTTAEPAPNGNSVSIEEEMLNAVKVSNENTRAIAIYRHGLNVIRMALGR
tara:strand:+ start:2714 stop:3094 length:381 start_codon:yes stop_codon:yes gene_type:complete